MNKQNQNLSLAQKAVLASVALAPVLTMAAEGDGAVSVDASSITALMGPVAVVGGAIMTILIAIKGWKLVRKAL